MGTAVERHDPRWAGQVFRLSSYGSPKEALDDIAAQVGTVMKG